MSESKRDVAPGAESTEVAFLRWAAGHPAPPALPVKVDEDRLLDSIVRHRLDVRMSTRIALEGPAWATPALRAELADLVRATRDRVRVHRAALAELTRRFDEIGRRTPVVIKGLTAHLSTGLDRALTRSADLDLIDPDPAGVVEVLKGLGYAVDDKDPPLRRGRNVRHEYAKLRRDSCEIDVHVHFPVWSYPRLGDHDTGWRPGTWRCVGDAVEGRITADQVGACRLVKDFGADTGVTFATVEMAVLVSCCHLFANHLVEFPAPSATIRLGELANIADMIDYGDFDRTKFDALVDEVGAHDAVAFTRLLLREHLGRSSRVAGRAEFPRDLWWALGRGGFIVSTYPCEPLENMVVRSSGVAELVAWLGAESVPAGGSSPGPVMSIATGAGRGVRRYLTSDGCDVQPLRMSAVWGEDALELSVTFVGPYRSQLDLLVQIGEAIFECVRHADGRVFAYDRRDDRRVTDGPAVAASTEPDGEAIVLKLPWSVLGAGQPADGVLPLMLGGRSWAADGDGPIASTLVPMRLHRDAT